MGLIHINLFTIIDGVNQRLALPMRTPTAGSLSGVGKQPLFDDVSASRSAPHGGTGCIAPRPPNVRHLRRLLAISVSRHRRESLRTSPAFRSTLLHAALDARLGELSVVGTDTVSAIADIRERGFVRHSSDTQAVLCAVLASGSSNGVGRETGTGRTHTAPDPGSTGSISVLALPKSRPTPLAGTQRAGDLSG